MSILALREMGKTRGVKGVTTKSKRDLVRALAEDNTEMVSLQVMQDEMIMQSISTDVAKENMLKGEYGGYVMLNENKLLWTMYDANSKPMDIILPSTLAKSVGVMYGDFVVVRAALYERIKFATEILSINNKNALDVTVRPTRQLCLVPSVSSRVVEMCKQSDAGFDTASTERSNMESLDAKEPQNAFVCPLATNDEIALGNVIGGLSITSPLHGSMELAYGKALTALYTLNRISQGGVKVTAYVDLDRTKMALSKQLDDKDVTMALVRLLSCACEYQNGGALRVMGLTTSQSIFDSLKSFALTHEVSI